MYVFHKSKGFFTDSKLLIATCVYTSVVFELLCPNRICICLKLVPFSCKIPKGG